MKNTKLALIFLFSMIVSWLGFSIIWTIVSGLPYIETLRQPEQLVGVMFLYWWMPGIFIIHDLED